MVHTINNLPSSSQPYVFPELNIHMECIQEDLLVKSVSWYADNMGTPARTFVYVPAKFFVYRSAALAPAVEIGLRPITTKIGGKFE